MSISESLIDNNLQQAKRIIQTNRFDLAFLIGNGINRYDNISAISWKQLILDIWGQLTNCTLNDDILQDISLTECYDLIDLLSHDSALLKEKIITKIESIQKTTYQDSLVSKFQELDTPVLTMNFDQLLEQGLNKYRMINPKEFTDFYPWSDYYSNRELQSPTDGFSIWHINGMMSYKRSIRLSLSEYMRQVIRTNSYLHNGNSLDNFYGKNTDHWNGNNTWLHIFFNKSLFIFGLALNQNEVFLRWLLIQRERYFQKFPERRKNSWFICPSNENLSGTKFFLEQINFQIIELESLSDIYCKMFEIVH